MWPASLGFLLGAGLLDSLACRSLADAGASETTDQSLSPEQIPSAKQTLSVLIHAKTNFGYNLLRWVKE